MRRGETVKAYPINRYVDPANPREMHERHVVYRVEETPSWKLQSNANQQILVGNLVTTSPMSAGTTQKKSDAAAALIELDKLKAEEAKSKADVRALVAEFARFRRNADAASAASANSTNATASEVGRLKADYAAMVESQTKLKAELAKARDALAAKEEEVRNAQQSQSEGVTPADAEKARQMQGTIPTSAK